jgi:hypothetical protein
MGYERNPGKTGDYGDVSYIRFGNLSGCYAVLDTRFFKIRRRATAWPVFAQRPHKKTVRILLQEES